MKLNAKLSKRESQIAELLAWGASKKEVADKLFVSTRTIENTARNIYAKIGIQKATELCVWWFLHKVRCTRQLRPIKTRLHSGSSSYSVCSTRTNQLR